MRPFVDPGGGGDGRVGRVDVGAVGSGLAAGEPEEQPVSSTIDVTTPAHLAFPAQPLTIK